MTTIIKNGLILFVITLVAGGLLGFTNELTKEPIAAAQKAKQERALATIFQDASFEALEVTQMEDTPVSIQLIFEASQSDEVIGYAFEIVTHEGYGGAITFMVGLDVSGSVKGIDIIKHAETPGLGAKITDAAFKNQFSGLPLDQIQLIKGTKSQDDQVEAISAATISSDAIVRGVNACITYYETHIKRGVE